MGVLGMQCYLVDQKILQQMALKKSLSGEAYQRISAAMSAIDGLKAMDIKEVQSMNTPPPSCIEVLAAVGYLVTDTNKKMEWQEAKKLMEHPVSFIQTLQTFNPESITADTLQKLKPITSQELFDPTVVKKCSCACAAMSQWVLAMQ